MPTIADLKPDPKNPRRHGERNIETIAGLLQEVGAARSIVIDEDDTILAGNGVVEAAKRAGIDRVRVIEADGDELIAVKRVGLTPSQKTKLKVGDNRSGELAEWDLPNLAIYAKEEDLSAYWHDDELAAQLASLDGPIAPIPGDPPNPELRAESFVEIWCSADDLAVFQPTLDAWSKRAGVTVNIT